MHDAFCIVKLSGDALDEVYPRIKQKRLDAGDARMIRFIRLAILCEPRTPKLSARQQGQLSIAIESNEVLISVGVACQCGQQIRGAFHRKKPV